MRFIEIALSSFLAGYTFMIAVRYSRRWAKLPRSEKKSWRGFLPLHVWTVSLSYCLLLTSATIEIYTRLGSGVAGPTWRSAVLLPAYILGVVAMISINRLAIRGRLKIQERSVQKQGEDVK